MWYTRQLGLGIFHFRSSARDPSTSEERAVRVVHIYIGVLLYWSYSTIHISFLFFYFSLLFSFYFFGYLYEPTYLGFSFQVSTISYYLIEKVPQSLTVHMYNICLKFNFQRFNIFFFLKQYVFEMAHKKCYLISM